MALGRFSCVATVVCCSLLVAACTRHNCVLRFLGLGGSPAGFGGAEPSPTPRDDPVWAACHQEHQAAVKAADAAPQGPNVLFYGDSITETWAGTELCGPCQRCAGVPAVFDRFFGKFNASVLAVGGDQSAHLMWRLIHGEVPEINKPKAVVLLIGTNDLGAAAWDADIHSAEETVMKAVPGVTLRVLQTLHLLRDLLPDSHIILLALLPRGGPGIGDQFFHYPSIYTQPMDMVNLHFRDYASLDAKLRFLDCGERFLTPSHRAINSDLMPDAIHPNAAGFELLAECISPMLTAIMQRPAALATKPAAHAAASSGGGSGASQEQNEGAGAAKQVLQKA